MDAIVPIKPSKSIGFRDSCTPATHWSTLAAGRAQGGRPRMRLHVSAKADYALRALVVLATQPEGSSVKTADIAEREEMPLKFLENILVDLRRKGLVTSLRGP